MIRYRDGKIVSTKGERFSQVKNNCNHSPSIWLPSGHKGGVGGDEEDNREYYLFLCLKWQQSWVLLVSLLKITTIAANFEVTLYYPPLTASSTFSTSQPWKLTNFFFCSLQKNRNIYKILPLYTITNFSLSQYFPIFSTLHTNQLFSSQCCRRSDRVGQVNF